MRLSSAIDSQRSAYGIIEDSDVPSDYLMAVCAVVYELVELRDFTQDLWRETAYEGLNGAVAASLTSTAVSMVKQTCLAVFFAEISNHDSYETMIKAITHGDPGKAQAELDSVRFHLSSGHQQENIEGHRLDIMEHLWLYDLVNVFSHIIVQRKSMKGEQHVYEKVDWSPSGPWGYRRRIFGLSEYASEITNLAMQKPGTDVRHRILPQHVFQLQCVVDSFTASRGWTLSFLRGHIVVPPPQDSDRAATSISS